MQELRTLCDVWPEAQAEQAKLSSKLTIQAMLPIFQVTLNLL